MAVEKHWSVTVAVNGEDLVTIESNFLSGKSDLSEDELEAVRIAGRHLISFAGDVDDR